MKLTTSALGKDKGSFTDLEINLEKQMQAWKENPTWVDQTPEIKVYLSWQKIWCTLCSHYLSSSDDQTGSNFNIAMRLYTLKVYINS